MNNLNIPNLENVANGLLTPGESLITTVCSKWASGVDIWALMDKPIRPTHFIRKHERCFWSLIMRFRDEGEIPDIAALYGRTMEMREQFINSKDVLQWINEMVISTHQLSTLNVNAHVEALVQEWFTHSVAEIEMKSALIKDPKERMSFRDSQMLFLNADPVLGGFLYSNARKTVALMLDDWRYQLEGGQEERRVGFGVDGLGDVILEKGCVAYVAGRAGMGKTTTLANMVREHMAQGRKIGVFTLEMTTLQIGHAVVAQMAEVSPQIFRNPLDASLDEEERIMYAFDEFGKKSIGVQETPGLRLDQLEDGIIAMKREFKGLDVVYVDHIHIMHEATTTNPSRAGVTKISGTLKKLAKKHDIAIIAAAQMNREADKRDNKEPRIADLRESGSIEQDADVILMVYRENYYQDDDEKAKPASPDFSKDVRPSSQEVDPAMKIFVRKNRHGERNNMVRRFDVDQKTRIMSEL